MTPAAAADGRPSDLFVAQPVGRIAPQPWMVAPATQIVMAALTADGAEARFIGGCVRDAVARRPIRDIDIAISEPPDRVTELLRGSRVRVYPTGIDHGTVTAVVGDDVFEVTSLRVDVETDGRHAKVAFTDDWRADAARRDFTINALSCTPNGDIYDYFSGLDDLSHGRVRFVGNARARIAEDVLRLLRFFRFHAWYGRPPADCDALAACRAMAGELPSLAGERVRVELLRTLSAADPADAVVLMRGEGVLPQILPEAGDVGRLRMMAWLDTRAVRVPGIEPDPLRRLASLIDTDVHGAEAVADRLRLSNLDRDRLLRMAAPSLAVNPLWNAKDMRRALRRVGADNLRDLALLAWAGELAAAPRLPSERTHGWIGLLEAAAEWTPLVFPLRGQDVLSLGVPAGPLVGDLLSQVEAWWEAADYRPDREACLARLRTVVDADAG